MMKKQQVVILFVLIACFLALVAIRIFSSGFNTLTGKPIGLGYYSGSAVFFGIISPKLPWATLYNALIFSSI